ncbi:MAG TPA: zinc-binding dehydrogenase [Bryobacteraceae bacterium]|nr:zinc-binding dehydrogenase [Bryobacteraceae bacterium]
MIAVRIHEYGGPEVLEYEDIDVPTPRPDEVLIRMKACALNHLDLWIRQGMPKVKTLPHILGSDNSGEVAAVGDLCWRVKPGQRVLIAPGVSCRQCEYCLSGLDNLCRQYTLFGSGVPGGNREYMTAPEYAVIPIPDSLSFEEAAAAPLVFLTAWHMLFGRANLQAGEDVLVMAASSGVGMAAIQLAKLFHCRVIATAGGEAKMTKAKALGADHVIDHYKQDIAAEVKAITGKRGVDVVFEHVGAATFAASTASIAPGGRWVTCGITTGYDVKLDLRPLFTKHQVMLGSFMGTLGELHKVLKFVFQGKLKPVVDRTFPMQEIAAAHTYLENKEQFGKVVVLP